MTDSERIEILNNLNIDVTELIENLQFEYQHSPNYQVNPTAFRHLNETSGDWLMCTCPSHPESRASFGISMDAPYNCNCFYCGYLGTIDKIIELAFDLEEGEGLSKLLTDYVVDEKRNVLDIETIIRDGREHHSIPGLPLSELTKFDYVNPNDWNYRLAKAYMNNRRGINDHTMQVYDVKIDLENDCIVFPQYTRKGELRFLQKRKVGDNYKGVKFINEGSAVKKDILYGLHLIERFKSTPNRIRRVRMVESPIDVQSNYQVGIPSVAINGKILFHNQVRELQLAGIDTVDLFFDNDEAGQTATKEATELLLKKGFHVNHVIHPQHLMFAKHDSNSLMLLGWLDKLEIRDVTLLN